jgi:hypothetical protein
LVQGIRPVPSSWKNSETVTQTDSTLIARLIAKAHEYLEIPSVVGHEQAFLSHLERDFSSLGAECQSITGGLVVRRGEGPVFLCAIDRPGLISLSGGGYGYAAEAYSHTSSSALPVPTLAQLEKFHTGEQVYAYDPATGGKLAFATVQGFEALKDGGVRAKLQGMIPMEAGRPLAIANFLDRSRPGYIAGFGENIASVVCLRLAFELGLQGTIIFVGSFKTGHAGGFAISHFTDLISADMKSIFSISSAYFDDAAPALAGAVILRRRDEFSSFDERAVTRLENAASSVAAPIIFKDSFVERESDARRRRGAEERSMGSTLRGVVTAESRGQFSGASLQIPVFLVDGRLLTTSARAMIASTRTLLAIQ